MRNPKLLTFAVLAFALAAPAVRAQTAAPPAANPNAGGFASLDANHDGTITHAEWKGNDIAFAMQDANGDGVLSGSELQPKASPAVEDPATTFAKLDSNHDGRLVRTEWTGDPADLALLDHNRDGAVTRDEFLNLDREKGRLDRLFRTLDKNKDGRVTKAEWPGTKFDSLDHNHDGIVTREEFSRR